MQAKFHTLEPSKSFVVSTSADGYGRVSDQNGNAHLFLEWVWEIACEVALG